MSLHPAFAQTGHRPWPAPSRPWAWRLRWLDFAFIHFETDAAALQRLLPPGVELELYDGKAWLGIIPFRMTGVTKRGWPAPSFLCDFAEINVRTYVTVQGKPGVWFLSLDAANPVAAWTARTFFHVPYFTAAIALNETSAGISYSAKRGEREFSARYTPGEPAPSLPGSFEEWATERYCLYSCRARDGRIFRTEVQHPRWPLQRARIEIERNTLTPLHLGPMHPSVLFSRELDVVMWSLEPLT